MTNLLASSFMIYPIRFSLKSKTMRCLLYLVFLSLIQFLFFVPTALSWEILTDKLDLKCTQTSKTQLDCDYRLLLPEPPLAIHAGSAGSSLDITGNISYPWPGGITAILFMVDTSDPGRSDVVEINIKQIAKLLEFSKPYHRIGLASFDKKLRIEAPIGAPEKQILSASKSLRAVGRTTEFYRNILKAINVLADIEADRKSIFLFSDGQAEDKAYHHQDVIRAARKAGVIINGLGYPRSVSLSVALQNLRRLSEETGGVFVETDNSYELPKSFLGLPFANIDSGGKFSIDLSPLSNRATLTSPEIALTFETDIGDLTTQIPVTLAATTQAAFAPATAAASQTTARPSMATDNIPVIQVVTTPALPQEIDSLLWYGVPVALIVLIILTIITLIVIYRQKGAKPASRVTETPFKPFAYLIVQDEKATNYPITSTTWRIGRSKDNELTLQDNSVSRRHAEIHRYSNGKFIIFDVDSLNGIFVNDEKIKKKKLHEGDIIEIGDIFLRFSLYSADFQLDEDTAVQSTKTPVHS